MTSSRRNTDPEPDDAQRSALILLRMLPALPDQRLNQLLASYDPKSLIDHATPELIGAAAYAALKSSALRDRLTNALRMVDKLSVSVISTRDPLYPARLRPLEMLAPPIIFMRGRSELLDNRIIAVVGARDSTEYGDSVAELFASELAQRSVTVISGLARGIDGIAHDSALRAGGSTIAVLGCGIDVSYPPRNAQLQERIAEAGLLISEFAPGTTAFPKNFPQRNRLIALLSSGVLVVEAGVRSGSLKTVDWALRYNVEVFAVPGPIGRPESQGTNEILRDGGNIALSIRDLFEVLKWADAPAVDCLESIPGDAVPLSDDPMTRALYSQLSLTASHVDALARKVGLSVQDALMHLLQLELEGVVVQHPGKRFCRVRPTVKRSFAAKP